MYVVHYEIDNRARTPGRCRTDHPLERGDFIDVRDQRAVVVSCHAVTEAPARRPTNQGDRRTT